MDTQNSVCHVPLDPPDSILTQCFSLNEQLLRYGVKKQGVQVLVTPQVNYRPNFEVISCDLPVGNFEQAVGSIEQSSRHGSIGRGRSLHFHHQSPAWLGSSAWWAGAMDSEIHFGKPNLG